MSEEIIEVNEADIKLQEELPESEDECLEIINRLNLSMLKNATVTSWYIGRVLAHLVSKGNAHAVKDASKKLKIGKRALQYCHSFYTKHSDAKTFKKVMEATEKGYEWSDLRELTTISNPQNRNKLLSEMSAGTLDKSDYKEKLDKVKTKEKAPTDDVGPDLGEYDRELKAVRRKLAQTAEYMLKTKLKMFDSVEQEVDGWLVMLLEDYHNSKAKDFQTYAVETDIETNIHNIGIRVKEIAKLLSNIDLIVSNFIDESMTHVKEDD